MVLMKRFRILLTAGNSGPKILPPNMPLIFMAYVSANSFSRLMSFDCRFIFTKW